MFVMVSTLISKLLKTHNQPVRDGGRMLFSLPFFYIAFSGTFDRKVVKLSVLLDDLGHYQNTKVNHFVCVRPLTRSYLWSSKVNYSTEDGVQPYKSEQSGPEAQISGTTEIVDDMEKEIVAPDAQVTIPKTLYSTQPFDSGFLNEWFAKPVRLSSGVLSNTDLADTIPNIFHPSGVLDTVVFKEKLRGYSYWRGTVVYTLQVNASPFHQGLYALAYIPVCGLDRSNSSFADWTTMHYQTMTQRSQLPHAQIDLAEQTSTELEVPFASAYSLVPLSYPLQLTYTDIGRINLFPLVPLTTGTGQDLSVGYTLWAHMKDVHLEVPAYPQSSIRSKKKGTPGEKEALSKNIGPVQSTLAKFSKVAKIMTNVPFLSDIAAPAAWALDIAGGVASTFGWSKPTNLDIERKIQKDCMYGMQHIDSSDNSKVLALSEKNTIEILPGFSSTNIDELAFDTFLTRPSIYKTFNWSSSDASGLMLFSNNVGPNSFAVTRTIATYITHSFSPMGFLAQYFSYWRGDIIVSFHMVKTRMHSGRLQISFTPKTTSTGITIPTADNAVYEWREIVDIRDLNKLSFRIPFQSFRSYKPVFGDFSSLGYISVRVLDELVAPTTVANNIDIVCWISAAPGFEFAVPRQQAMYPLAGLPVVATPQSTFGNTPGKNLLSTNIGNSKSVDDVDNEHARMCIGEKVTSLRQLLRITRLMVTDDAEEPLPAATVFGFHPFVYPTHKLVSGSIVHPEFYGDLMSVLGSVFALSRGGVRIKTFSDSSGITYSRIFIDPNEAYLPAYYMTTETTDVGHSGVYCNSLFTVSSNQDRAGTELMIPAYGMGHSRANAACMYYKSTGILVNNSLPPVFVRQASTFPRTINLARSGADDFNMGLFVSIPVMLSVTPVPGSG